MNDVRYAFRTLRTSPGFALTAILTLALGIGLATAVFTVADALLLRRLPVRDQDRLVVLWGRKPDREFAYPLGLDDAREFARQTRSLDGVAYTIVGVMPQGLDYPRGTDCWAPVVPSTVPKDLYVIGRIAAGRTAADAQDELTAFFRRPGGSRWGRDLRGVVHTLPRLILGDTRPALIVFAAAAGLLLLITCINVANLLLVRGLARVREIAVRSALGAGRGHVIVQLLTENALLALAGGAIGLAVAGGAVRSFVAFAPAGLIARSLIKLERAELSLEPSHLLIGDLTLRYDRFDTAAKQRALLERLLSQVRAIPGVRAASPVVAVPFSGSGGWDGKPMAEGQTAEQAAANPMLNMEVVAPDYFAALRIPVRRGRVF